MRTKLLGSWYVSTKMQKIRLMLNLDSATKGLRTLLPHPLCNEALYNQKKTLLKLVLFVSEAEKNVIPFIP